MAGRLRRRSGEEYDGEVVRLAPCEKRITELLKVNKDKLVLKKANLNASDYWRLALTGQEYEFRESSFGITNCGVSEEIPSTFENL
ncbi:hypothetical protein G4B88_025459 [Cannabis sativa]|uniref:Uncharacterized protein n=1 Tax=Cannabis sativa TaxID=3483 RepID=A0A7J6HVQ2_CANSA|nr:hypothetical protein G4B88_025459 [Cannabis sativa]